MEPIMPTARPITIETHDRSSRDHQLEQAIQILKDEATDCGILITRHSFRTFTVSLSPNVEYGMIQELDLL